MFNLVSEQSTNQNDGHRGNQHQPAGPRQVIVSPYKGTRHRTNQFHDIVPKIGHDSTQCTEVAGYIECNFGWPRLPAQQVTNQNEVRRTRNREKLGQSLNEPEPGGLKNVHMFRSVSLGYRLCTRERPFLFRLFGLDTADAVACARRATRRSLITMAAAAAIKIVE